MSNGECQTPLSFRAERRELEDTAKVTRIREQVTAHAAALPDSAHVLPGCCCCALVRCVELFGQINDEIRPLANRMKEAERRAGERHDELIRRIQDLAAEVARRMGV